MRVNDPAHVARQYATEDNLEARRALYARVAGPDPREMVFEAVARVEPRRVLEVGGGPGELAARIGAELKCDVVMLDLATRMVELARSRGVEAEVGDVQHLPFPDATFDCAVAAWMLYHVPDVDRGVGELARVLRPGGRLVAATNASDHLEELLALGGVERFELAFDAGNGEEILGRHFALVERHDAHGTVSIDDVAALRAYFGSSERLEAGLDSVPATLDEPLVAKRHSTVFVATKAER